MQALLRRLRALHAVVEHNSKVYQPLRLFASETRGSAPTHSCSTLPAATATTVPADVPDPFGAPTRLPQRRVVVTGIGLVTPLGVGAAVSWAALLRGEAATRRLRCDDLPESHREHMAQLPCQVVAAVPREEVDAAAAAVGADPRRCSRFMAYALVAAEEALADAGWRPGSAAESAATGVSIGSGMSSAGEVSDAGALISSGRLRRLSPFFVPRVLANSAAGAVSIAHGLAGPNLAASTACATGVHCIGDAFRAVQRGDADAMLAGASEASIDAVSLGGFSRVRALATRFNDDPAAASRPFDAERDGFVMGEGAGVLLLEEAAAAAARGARVYGEVRGYGTSGDAHHVTSPHPSGAGAVAAMTAALRGSGLAPEDVAYVNAHATSTPVGDEIEQAAIRRVFGSACSHLLVSSTKGATGHLLGAAGAVEAAITILALHRRLVPSTVNLTRPAPDDLLPGLVCAGPPAQLRPGPAGALCNSFGFGGTNASILFATPPAYMPPVC